MSMGAYAPPAGSALSPDIARWYLNYTPEAGFWSYLQGRGLTGAGPLDRFAQGRFSNYYGRYLAEAANQPNLGFYDYLNTQRDTPESEFALQAPEARGDFSSRLLTPRARWSIR